MTEELLQDLAQYKTHKDKSKLHVSLCRPKNVKWFIFYLNRLFALEFLN